MSNKKYTLVAWTENGEVRMVPSLINEASRPYRGKIERIESQRDVDDEARWLLARCQAHEEFARFLLGVGRPREAYLEFENAAMVCTWCPDELWLQGDRCGFPALPLLYRFLSMHRECLRLALADRYLRLRYEGSKLQQDYRFFTLDDRETEMEISEELAGIRAWRFGKGS